MRRQRLLLTNSVMNPKTMSPADGEIWLELPTGRTFNTVEPSAIPDGGLEYLLNCTTYEGTFMLNKRVKFWKGSTSTTSAPKSFVIADMPSATICQRIVTLRTSGSNRLFDIAQIDRVSIEGALNSSWQNTGLNSVADSGNWARGWQHLSKVYFAGGASGTVYALDRICSSSTAASTQVFKEKPWASNQFSFSVDGDTLSDYPSTQFARTGSINTVRWTSLSAYYSAFTSSVTTSALTSWTFGTSTVAVSSSTKAGDTAIVGPASGATIGQSSIGRIVIGLADATTTAHLSDVSYAFPSPQDWTKVDYIRLRFDCVSGQDLLDSCGPGGTGNTNPYYIVNSTTPTWPETGNHLNFDSANFNADNFDVLVSPDASGSNWIKAEVRVQRLAPVPPSTNSKGLEVWVDLTKIPKSSIRRIRFVFAMRRPNWGVLSVAGWIGRRALLFQKPEDTLSSATSPNRSITYALRYKTADGLVSSEAILAEVGPSQARGSRPHPQLSEMGSWVSLTAEAVGAPFSSAAIVEFWRLVNVQATGQSRWYKIHTVTGFTAPYTFVDDISDRALIDNPASEWTSSFVLEGSRQYNNTDSVSGVACGTSWKGSNAIGLTDGKVSFTRVGTPENWIWPGFEPALDPDDPLNPRRLQVTSDGTAVTCLVPSDVLYIFSSTDCWAMSGEFASVADYPRRLPHGRGAESSRHACQWMKGAILADREGLWFQAVPFGFDGTAEQVQIEELTKDNRRDWEWLVTSGTAGLCVAASQKEILVFNGKKFLYIEESALVSRGELTCSQSVADVAYHPHFGFIVHMSDGSIGHVGKYPSDGGTDAGGANGSTVTWTASGRQLIADLHIVRAQTIVKNPTSATNVSLVVFTERGGSDTLNWVGAANRSNQAFPRGGIPTGGRWFKLQLSGGANDVVIKSRIFVSPADSRRNS